MLSVMQNASLQSKRLLHHGVGYALRMPNPNARLKRARINAGFKTAKDAAESLGVPISTYLGHENGFRGFPAKKAALYARRFKVTEQWLLYGKGPGIGDSLDPRQELTAVFDSLTRAKQMAALAMLKGLAQAALMMQNAFDSA